MPNRIGVCRGLPWKLRAASEIGVWSDGECSDEDLVCIIAAGPNDDVHCRLIAAVPKLLEERTLTAMQKHAPQYFATAIERLTRTIALATKGP